jgi:uncharacterized membrane protein
MGGFFPGHIIVILVVVLVVVIPFQRIFKKAGFAPALGFGLAMLLPVVNVILLFVLAFSEWPALKKSE